MKRKRAALRNLGCKVNACETRAMCTMLEQAGYEIVDFSECADVYVVNTCTVTQIADRKSRQMLHRAHALNPDAVIVAAGCYAESVRRENNPDDAVDIYLGNNEKSSLIEKINAFSDSRRRIFSETEILKSRTFEALPVSQTGGRVRAFLKIEDGCNRFCSYCLIPYVRGPVRSLPQEEVLIQAQSLVDAGCREIVLDGIHLTSYGMDLTEHRGNGPDSGLIALIGELSRIRGLDRIRLGSLEPDYITEETAGTLAGFEKLCPHFHLSLQSGCDTVLHRMNRRYTTEAFHEKCEILRRFFENPALTTDVITGFPGETQEEFSDTVSFLKKISFYQIHVFPYSPRKGTRAASMPDQVPGAVKKERRDVLLALTAQQQRVYEDDMFGKTVRVLIEEEKISGGICTAVGHTAEYLYASAKGRPGEIVQGPLARNETTGGLEVLV